MRKIKFRGKAKMSIEELNDMYFEHDNGWFYGNLVMYGDTPLKSLGTYTRTLSYWREKNERIDKCSTITERRVRIIVGKA